MKHYLHSNGRLQLRSGSGTFRQATSDDLGMGLFTCEDCGETKLYDLYEFRRENGFVIKKALPMPTVCNRCQQEADYAEAHRG